MTDLRKAAEMAFGVPLHEQLESVPEDARLVIEDSDGYGTRFIPVGRMCKEAVVALRQALAQPEQEQKTPLKVLNLTVFTENRLRNGRVYDVETLQAMTNRDILAIPDMGKKALKEVLEALDVYAVNMSQERVDETAKCEHEPVAWFIQYEYRHEFLWRKPNELEQKTALEIKPLYTAPPKREWVRLTDEEIHEVASKKWWDWEDAFDIEGFSRAIEAKLKERNGG